MKPLGLLLSGVGVVFGAGLALGSRRRSQPFLGEAEDAAIATTEPLFPVAQNDLSGTDRRIIAALNLAWSRGARFVVTDAMRTEADQLRHLEDGTTTILDSLHLDGLAVDVAPMRDDGQPEMHDLAQFRALAPRIKEAAEDLQVPLRWLPDFEPEKHDYFHWYIRRGDA